MDVAVAERRKRAKLTPYYFVTPAIVFLVVGLTFMLIYALVISFTSYQLQLNAPPIFIGLGNYIEAFQDAKLWMAIGQTAWIAIPALIGEIGLGLAMALFLNRNFRGRAVVISLVATPVMLSPAATGMVFRLLYEPRYGPINDVISRFIGRAALIDWLGSIDLARWSIVIVDIWHTAPLVMLLLLAGLANISDEIHEAARVDGANPLQALIYVTIPLLRPVLGLVILLRGVELIRMFDFIYIMTAGGPGTQTQTISYFIYMNGLQFFRVGYGSALAWMLALVCLVFAKLYFDYTRRDLA
jgi:multiple sugar transport system permease protein